MCARCLCCGGDKEKIIAKKCGCWIFHFSTHQWQKELASHESAAGNPSPNGSVNESKD